MESKNVIFAAKNGVGRIIINRPDKRNALSLAIRKRLKEVLRAVSEDEAIRVLIVTGAGEEAFVAGADLNELKDFNALQMLEYLETYGQKLYTEFERLPIPTIALIKGYCLGGGCELAMACDIRIASPNAKFGLPELRHGVIPGGGGTQRLVRLVGLGRAKELILTGNIINAREAERIGLINRVVPRNRIEKHVETLTDTIISQGPIAVKMAKMAMNLSVQGPMDMGLKIEALSEAVCYSTQDKKEGLDAFLEKRKPHFTNK